MSDPQAQSCDNAFEDDCLKSIDIGIAPRYPKRYEEEIGISI